MGRPRVLTLLLLSLLVTVPARGADPNLGTIASPSDEAGWSGHFEPILTPGGVETCALGVCDRFVLFLNLPAGTPGEAEVAIRWPSESTDTDLDLYVTDASGATVASSVGLDSEAEIARLPQDSYGLFDVWVVPISLSEPLDYEGLVQLEPPVAVAPLRDLLPNLTTLEPRTLAIATGEYYVDVVRNPALSCYPEETLDQDEQVPTRCLRFDQIAYNAGVGGLELRFNPADLNAAGSPDLRQVVRRSDGTSYERLAESSMEFHAVHGHWHYSGFGLGRLYDRDGDLVSQSTKKGFCLIDVGLERWGEHGNGPRAYSAPGCLQPDPDEDGDVVMRISSGWADVYNWFLADQFIDISDVDDDRVYRLEIIADPNNTIAESDETDNASSVWICLSGATATKVTGPTASCPA